MIFKKVDLGLKLKKYGIGIVIFFIGVYFSNFFDKFFDPLNDYLLGKLRGSSLAFYNLLSFLFSIKIPAYSLFVGIILVWLGYKIYRFFEMKKRKLIIIKAIYGKNNKYVDITSNLNDKIEDNKLKIVLNNSIAGDPIKGTIKEGIVKYKNAGVVNEIKYSEGNVIELP